jgi:hypothetical protein
MKELNSFFEGDFKVNLQTGEAFASLRVAGELCGVDKSTIHRYFATHNMSTKQGVTPEMLQKCNAHYAAKGKPEAIATLAKLAEAGAKAFIYHKAGVPLQPQQQLPTTSDAVALAQIELEKLKIESQVKLAEIDAKIKLGRKKTGIRRIPKDSATPGFFPMKDIERWFEDQKTPIPLSTLRSIEQKCWDRFTKQVNTINRKEFADAVAEVFNRFEDDGAYWYDPDTGIRTLKSKIDWF